MDEQYIPIDIHTNKLSDWLISRRHCNRDWQPCVLTIREKINNAIQDMPIHEGIAKLLSGSYINYFHCVKIIEILKETEASSKNFFGSYGSQRMKDWQEIVRLYERDNAYLAEAGQMLTRNVNYEIPSMKRQIARYEQMLLELAKKETEYGKLNNVLNAEYQTMCKQLGIEGKKIKHELVGLVTELPGIYKRVAETFKTLDQIVKYYIEFVKFVIGSEYPGEGVALLKYIIEHGNTTTYEWKYGHPPLKIEEPPLNITLDEEANTASADDTIDFGDGDGIDFGDDSGGGGGGGEIDWGISIVPDENQDISVEESGIVVESSGKDEGVAKGKEAFTLLDNPETRNRILDSLTELEAFLKIRSYEMEGASSLLTLSQLQDGPTILQIQTAQSIEDMLDKVEAVTNEITNSRIQELHNIKHSPRYVDNLTNSVNLKLELAEKMLASQEVVRQRQREVQEEVSKLEPKLKLIISKTRELQKEIEGDISKRYKNRPVNIMGSVNTM